MDVGKLFSFDGRIGRGAFWGLSLVVLVAELVAFALIGTAAELLAGGSSALVVALAVGVIVLFVIISLATNVKRWHDRDKSGFWMLISLVPIIGPLWAFIEQGFLSGTAGPNRYGIPSGGSPFAG